jgi:hypothetical protein
MNPPILTEICPDCGNRDPISATVAAHHNRYPPTDNYEDECTTCTHCRAGHYDDGTDCLIGSCECAAFTPPEENP